MGIFTDILGGFIDNAYARKNLKLQQNANRNLADYAYSKQLDMFNLQNSYNTPQAQMERYKQAGLNPNLIYSQGTPGNTATSTPTYQQENVRYDFKNPINKINLINTYQDLRIKQSNIDNLAEQNRILKAEADLREADARYADGLSRGKLLSRQYQNDILRFKREVTSNEFFSIFESYESNGETMYVPKDPEWFNKVMKDRTGMASTITENYQQSIKNQRVIEQLRGKDLEFLEHGGKYFTPILQFLQFIRGK